LGDCLSSKIGFAIIPEHNFLPQTGTRRLRIIISLWWWWAAAAAAAAGGRTCLSRQRILCKV